MTNRKRVRAAPATPEQRAEIDAILAETEGRTQRKPAIEHTELGSSTSMTNEAFHAMLGVIRQLEQSARSKGRPRRRWPVRPASIPRC